MAIGYFILHPSSFILPGGFSQDEDPLPLVLMGHKERLAKPVEEAAVRDLVGSFGPFLDPSLQEVVQRDAGLARQMLARTPILREFERCNSEHGIQVRMHLVDWNDAFRYFTDYVRDPTNPPLVAQMGDTWAAHFRSLGALRYERRYTWDVRILWYWKDLVSPETISDGAGFLSASRRLRREPPPGLVAPFAIPTALSWDLLHDLSVWLYNSGVRSLIVTEKRLGLFEWKRAALAGPEGERAAEFLIRLAREGLVALPEKLPGEVAEDFLSRKYAMAVLGPWFVKRAEAIVGPAWESEIGATLPPSLGAGPPTTVKGGSLLVVLDPSRGQDKDNLPRARQLVDFLTSADSQRRQAEALTDLPGNPEALAAHPHIHIFSKALEEAILYPEIPEWAPVVEKLLTRDNLYAFWKRLAALAETAGTGAEMEQQTRERFILGALQSAQVEIDQELSSGKLSALWPWLLGLIAALSVVTSVSIWRRRAERQWNLKRLAQSEARYRDLYDHAPDMFSSVDVVSGRIVECNQTLVNKTGYSREEIIGRHIFDMYHPDCLEEVQRALEKFRETGEVRDLELELRTKNGEKLAVGVNVSAVRDEEGRVIQTRSVWRDLTERRRVEELAELQRQELAHVARVATLGELTASLAHQLNQPLTAVVSNAQAAKRLLNRREPDLLEAQSALGDIAREGKRAADVIHTLRAMLRKGNPEPTEVDLNEIIRETVSLVQGQAILKHVNVRLEPAGGLPAVLGNRVQLQQVLLNLMVNAVEAMDRLGREERELVIRTAAASNGSVEVAVQDSGIGLEEGTRERIFDPFFTTKAKGLGMGLSINRSIIEAHGGRLWATRNSDRGTTFHFTLPVCIEAAAKCPGSPEG